MTKKDFCLVEVSVWFVDKGECYWSSKIDDYLWEVEPATLSINKGSVLQTCFWNSFQTPMDIYFTAPNTAFSFRTFGQGTSDEWSNPFDWLIDIGIDKEELFRSWLSDLKKSALFILGEANKKKIEKYPQEKPSNHVNFVTAWHYHGFQVPETSYGGGDWEDEWELIGAVNLEKIPFSIMKTGEDSDFSATSEKSP